MNKQMPYCRLLEISSRFYLWQLNPVQFQLLLDWSSLHVLFKFQHFQDKENAMTNHCSKARLIAESMGKDYLRQSLQMTVPSQCQHMKRTCLPRWWRAMTAYGSLGSETKESQLVQGPSCMVCRNTCKEPYDLLYGNNLIFL